MSHSKNDQNKGKGAKGKGKGGKGRKAERSLGYFDVTASGAFVPTTDGDFKITIQDRQKHEKISHKRYAVMGIVDKAGRAAGFLQMLADETLKPSDFKVLLALTPFFRLDTGTVVASREQLSFAAGLGQKNVRGERGMSRKNFGEALERLMPKYVRYAPFRAPKGVGMHFRFGGSSDGHEWLINPDIVFIGEEKLARGLWELAGVQHAHKHVLGDAREIAELIIRRIQLEKLDIDGADVEFYDKILDQFTESREDGVALATQVDIFVRAPELMKRSPGRPPKVGQPKAAMPSTAPNNVAEPNAEQEAEDASVPF